MRCLASRIMEQPLLVQEFGEEDVFILMLVTSQEYFHTTSMTIVSAPPSVVLDNDKVEVDHSPPTASWKMKKKNKKKKLKDVTVSDGEQENVEDNVDTTDGEPEKSEDSDQGLPKDESDEQEEKEEEEKEQECC